MLKESVGYGSVIDGALWPELKSVEPSFNLLDRHGLDQAITELSLKSSDPSFNVAKVTSRKPSPLLGGQILVDSGSDRNRVFFLLEVRSVEFGGIQNTLIERL